MANFKQVKKMTKQVVQPVTTSRFLFVNKGRNVAIEVEYAIKIPKYRIHEIFNRECVGSKYDLVAEPNHIKGYTQLAKDLNSEINFKITEVKKSE